MIEAGQKFPDFRLQNQKGETRTLADYAGKWLVLYIYPKDDTTGCTIQARSFTATKDEYLKAGIQVVGLSADDVASHEKFCNKHSLTLELLADPKTELLQKTGVGQSEHKGNLYWNRSTFIIDPQGTVRKVYTAVKPEGHEQVLLRDIHGMKAGVA